MTISEMKFDQNRNFVIAFSLTVMKVTDHIQINGIHARNVFRHASNFGKLFF